MWIFELTLIYLWIALVFRFEKGLNLIKYRLGDEGNISVNTEIVKKIFIYKFRVMTPKLCPPKIGSKIDELIFSLSSFYGKA